MCGIAGFVGEGDARAAVLDALRRLEYRGYDSAGVALRTPGGLAVAKQAGRVADLEPLVQGASRLGIGHTRWATHGRPTRENAHPHVSCDAGVALVHNGIITNHHELRERLRSKGHAFASQTDTETFVHLVEENRRHGLLPATLSALPDVEGSFAFVLIAAEGPEEVVAARRESPLVVGLLPQGHMVASDVTALLPYTRRMVILADGEVARLTRERVEVFDFHGRPVPLVVQESDLSPEAAERGGFPHFMLKELHDAPRALQDLLAGRVAGLPGRLDVEGRLPREIFGAARRVLLLGSGTSYHACLLGARLLGERARMPASVRVASEFRFDPLPERPDLAIAVTQSGETADVLGALRRLKAEGIPALSVTNVAGSSAARLADADFHIRAGPEVSVAATKTFLNQAAALSLVAVHAAHARGVLPPSDASRAIDAIRALPRVAQRVLDEKDAVARLGAGLSGHERILLLGRGSSYPAALEGALKLKEVAYIHAEAFPAGELKHGPLALVERGTPALVLLDDDASLEATLSNMGELAARDARVIALAPEGRPADRALEVTREVLRLPPSEGGLGLPLAASLALQLLAYHAASARGCEIDRPRNLAKSVTVE